MSTTLEALRPAMEGSTPALIATCAPDGTPNVSYLSAVHYIDSRHLALSFQFFSKTRSNVLANPYARIMVVHPVTTRRHRLLVQYLRTESEGPLFEKLGAKLAGIASHEGMQDVFQLRGADVYRVLAIEEVPGAVLPAPPEPNRLPALRAAIADLSRAPSLEALFDRTLSVLQRHFDITHSMILLRDAEQGRLFTVASRGYADVPVGSEVLMGRGVIGVAASTGVPIRISHALAEHTYAKVVRSQAEALAVTPTDAETIPFHGLPAPGSQLALPFHHGQNVAGVLYLEAVEAQRFGYDDEDALATLTDVLALAMQGLQDEGCEELPQSRAETPERRVGPNLNIRFYQRLSTVFINDQYVIKGIAGAVLWKCVRAWCEEGRCEFSSRELRADRQLNLPEYGDNLAARLLLLQRRLDELGLGLYLQKSARGKVRLSVLHPVNLQDDTAAS